MFRLIIFFLFLPMTFFAQEEKSVSSTFVGLELQGGKIVPNTSSHPKTKGNYGIHLHLGLLNSGNHAWAEFYNYPELGISLGYNHLGEKEIFGSEFSLTPYVIFPTSKNPKKGIHIKFAGGISYFTKKYDEIENPENLYVGSHPTWAFNLSFYKSLRLSNKFVIKPGISFRHASNGHTALPNYGVNSIVASMIFQLHPSGIPDRLPPLEKPDKKEYHFYFITEQGIGTHELGGPISPIGGEDGLISTSTLSLGILFKKHILVRSGFSYRYYELYKDYIEENNLQEYSNNKTWSSSNLIFSIGTEFLIGHFSIDIQGGLNITKPFYRTHFDVFENTNNYDWVTKRWFTTKFGFNVYLFNTKKLPKHNVRIGAFINANFGQADFTEFGLGYLFKIK